MVDSLTDFSDLRVSLQLIVGSTYIPLYLSHFGWASWAYKQDMMLGCLGLPGSRFWEFSSFIQKNLGFEGTETGLVSLYPGEVGVTWFNSGELQEVFILTCYNYWVVGF